MIRNSTKESSFRPIPHQKWLGQFMTEMWKLGYTKAETYHITKDLFEDFAVDINEDPERIARIVSRARRAEVK